jgi:hypothetical protein
MRCANDSDLRERLRTQDMGTGEILAGVSWSITSLEADTFPKPTNDLALR